MSEHEMNARFLRMVSERGMSLDEVAAASGVDRELLDDVANRLDVTGLGRVAVALEPDGGWKQFAQEVLCGDADHA